MKTRTVRQIIEDDMINFLGFFGLYILTLIKFVLFVLIVIYCLFMIFTLGGWTLILFGSEQVIGMALPRWLELAVCLTPYGVLLIVYALNVNKRVARNRSGQI